MDGFTNYDGDARDGDNGKACRVETGRRRRRREEGTAG